MWLKTRTPKSLPIGVDLGSSSVKMAQVEVSSKGLELLAARSAEIPHEFRRNPASRLDYQGRQIHDIFKSGGFKGRKAVLSLPADLTFVHQVKIPASLADHLDEAVSSELAGKLPYPVSKAVIRHCFAGTVYDNGQEMEERFVVAAARDEVDSYIRMAHHAGLDVVGLDIEACAVVECFARLFRPETDESRVTLFIDIGWASTQIVLAHGRRMVFARNLSVGGQAMDQTVAEVLQIPIEQAFSIRRKMLDEGKSSAAEDDLFRLLDKKITEITDEIIRCVRYHESVFTNRATERVIFVGGQAHNSRLCESIAKRLNLPAQIGDPMAGIKWAQDSCCEAGPDCQEPQPSWVVAIGLSLGAALAPFGGVKGTTAVA